MSRETLLPRLADHVLEHGLAGLSLRPLARAAGTSDRMLIYHFGSKEALVGALLDHVTDLFSASLDTAFPQDRWTSRQACARAVYATTGQPEFAPFFRLWWDIVAGCADGDAAYREAAIAMMDRLLAWVELHLPADDPDPAAGARAVMTMVEGAQMLRAVGRGDVGEAGLAALQG